MKQTLCAILAAAAMAVGCGKVESRDNFVERQQKTFILPYAAGTKQLWFNRNADGSFNPYIEVKERFMGNLITAGCLYAPGEGNEKYCAGKLNPTSINQIQFDELTTQLRKYANFEYLMEGIDARIRNPVQEK